MRYIAKKVLAIALVIFSPMLFGITAKAQFVVTDPGNFVGNIANTTSQIAQAVEEFGVMTKQLDEIKKVYRAVDGAMRLYTGIEESWDAINDLQYTMTNTVKRLQGDSYLTTAEKVALISGCGKFIQYATKDIKSMTMAQDGNSGTGFGNTVDRIRYLDDIKAKIFEYRNLANYFTSRYSNVSYMRRSQSATQLKFDMLTGGRR